MSILRALDECLTYVRQSVPAFDDAALSAPLHLPFAALESWGEVLASAPAATALRSGVLQPFAQNLTGDETFYCADLQAELAAFRAARRRLVTGGEAVYHPELTVEREDRRAHALLVIEPAGSLSDGAAQVASAGYLDANNMPPWDTWLTSVTGLSTWGPALVCWVPAWAREHVQAGIEVNPERCLSWAHLDDDRVVFS